MEGLKQNIAETAIFSMFWQAGTRLVFFLIIYTIDKHSGSATRRGADSPDKRGWVGRERLESGAVVN